MKRRLTRTNIVAANFFEDESGPRHCKTFCKVYVHARSRSVLECSRNPRKSLTRNKATSGINTSINGINKNTLELTIQYTDLRGSSV